MVMVAENGKGRDCSFGDCSVAPLFVVFMISWNCKGFCCRKRRDEDKNGRVDGSSGESSPR